jgi:two-component system, OmpR family, response regulator
MNVLVVEDDDGSRTGLVLLLQSIGHTVYWAATGEGALNLVRTERVDVVILDIMLPDISGYEVARRLPRGLPIVILSALDADMIRHDATEFQNAISGALLIMTKPVDEVVLEDVLLRIKGALKA